MKEHLYGPYGSTEPETARHVRECGGNAVWFHGFNPKGFDSAGTAGLHPCVEFKTFRASFDEHPELIPIGVDGKPIRYGRLVQGVCLSKTDFVEERMADLEAGMREFKPRGVWLDYLTYAGWFETPEPDLQESCFCPDCIEEFCRAEEVDATSPAEILTKHEDSWTAHKCRRIDSLGRRFSAIIKNADPDCPVGIYMCPWTPDEFVRALTRIFAQDYRLLAEWADVFTPLMYAEKSGRPPEWSRTFLEATPRFVPEGVPVLPILDVLDFPESVAALADSEVSSFGFQLFGGAKAFDDPEGRRHLTQAIAKLESSRR